MTTTHLPLPAELPTTATTLVGDYPTYAAAQQAVDYLSDQGFPVQHATIVGVDLRLVETVTGRLTVGRAAASGAGAGAWFGLLAGAVLALFTTAAWLAVLTVTALGGAVWGAVMAAVAHAATRGRRDFTSHRRLAAARYHVTVDAEHADDAGRLLLQHTWRML
jgi:hypothetical protein